MEISAKRSEPDVSDEEPTTKIRKLDLLKLNPKYFNNDFEIIMMNRWNANEGDQVIDPVSGLAVYQEPYQIGVLPELLQTEQFVTNMVEEIVNKVKLARMKMDLYEFYRSSDISKMPQCTLLTEFFQVLQNGVRPWLEKITNLKLDYVSASCSMFTCGDYLLPHDDLLNDRQIAFIYYVSPWSEYQEWKPESGGGLEIFNSDEKGFPQFPVQRVIPPKNNQLIFFKVGKRSFHQVEEVKSFDYPRLTINGWFHGAANCGEHLPTQTYPIELNFQQPDLSITPNLGTYIKPTYLDSNTAVDIQQRMEANSEICLYNFFKMDFFEQLRGQLLNDDTLTWLREGPPNSRNYESLDYTTASGVIKTFTEIFKSSTIFSLLRDYSGLDLSGSDAITPSCRIELQKWTHGDYTLLSDESLGENPTLDLIYFINASYGSAIHTYLAPSESKIVQQETLDDSERESDNSVADAEESSSVLLTVPPVDNALNLIYRLEDTTKFVKYINHRVPMHKGPVFILNCSYRE